MGSWNKTCGLTGLHIIAGSQTYVFLLKENTIKNDRCYSTALWSPLLLPFTAEYDDYGGGENSSDLLQYILDGIKTQVVEMELGENECHGIAVKRDALAESLF